MDIQTDSLLVKRALKLFTPDIFFHPVWVRFAHQSFLRQNPLSALKAAIAQAQRAGDPHSTCKLLFLRAAEECRAGDFPAALDSLGQAQQLAQRRRMTADVVCAYWGGSAVQTQWGKYAFAADQLYRLEALLKAQGEWRAAGLVEMVAQALERVGRLGPLPSAALPLTSDPMLAEAMRALLRWGRTPAAGEMAYLTDQRAAFWAGWQDLLRRVIRWLRGEVRLGWIAGQGMPSAGQDPAAVEQPAAEELPAARIGPEKSVSPAAGTLEPGAPDENLAADQQQAQEPQQPLDRKLIPITGKEGAGLTAQRWKGIAWASAVFNVVKPAAPLALPTAANATSRPESRLEQRLEQPSLAFYFLGSFRVFQDDQQVSDWSSQRSLSILKYLAVNHGKPVGKELLMDLFWAEADAEVARRNLHQAIYALRQTLKRGRPDFAYIQFENDCYLLNPALHTWLDIEAFEKHHQTARQMDDAGRMEEAIAAYSLAEEYYQGDFLEDDLYEDWPNSSRVYYRALYLDLLDHLSGYCIEQNQYAPAILLCKKILAKDNCAEQAYRALIQCYLAQGQRQLAVREYQNCVITLKHELNLAPSAETQALYQRIFV